MRFFRPNLPKRAAIFSLKHKLYISIEFCIFELVFVSNLTLNSFEFWTKFAQDRYAQKQKKWTSSLILLIQISLGNKFQLKLTILIFLTRFTQKDFSGLKQKKWTPHIFNIILHIQISAEFQRKLTIFIFGSNFHKRVFLVKNWKS